MYNSTEYYINKGKELAKNGKYEEAANSFYEAIKIDKKYIEAYNLLSESLKILAESEPYIYLPALAMILNNLGILQCDERDYKHAQKSFTEALKINKKLAKKNHHIYLPNVATTLYNLGISQYDDEEYTHADKSFKKALEIYKNLAEKKPHIYLPDVAKALNYLGNLQSFEKQYSFALKSYTEALEIRRKLAENEPHTYLPDVAMTLDNLGVLQKNEQDYKNALKFIKEALGIRRKLAENEPHTYLPNVATTLNNLGNVQSFEKQYSFALKSYTEALEIRRKLAENEPHIYLPDVAMTLNDLGVLQSNERNYKHALKSYSEALKIYKKLAKKNPHIYFPDVARFLNNLGNLQKKEKNYKHALKSYTEALNTYKKVTKNKHIHLPDVAMTLNNLGNLQSDERDYKNALKSFSEALKICKKLAKKNPHIYLPNVAMTLSNLGTLQSNERNYKHSLKSYTEALNTYKKVTKNKHIHLPNVASILNNLGVLQSDKEEYSLAYKSYTEALEILEQLLNTTTSYPILKGDITRSYQYLLADAVKNKKKESAFYLFWSLHEKNMTREKAENNLPKLHKELKVRGTQNNKNLTILCAQDCHDFGFVIGKIDENNIEFELVKDNVGVIKEILFHLSSSENKNHEINAIIQSFYNKLPHFVKELFSVTEKEKKEIIICGDTFFSAFPWELLPCTDNRNDFLGLHYSLPRLSNLSFEELDAFVELHYGNNKDYSIIAPHDTDFHNILGIVPDEAKQIQKNLKQQEFVEQDFYLGGDANRENFETILEKELSLIYYSGHGGIIQNETCLILHNNSSYKDTFSFSRYHLGLLRERTKRNKLFSQNPLFILNSCYSGMTRSYGATKEDFISSLIDEGAGGVIASPMPIYQGVGFDFGTIFLNYLTDMNNVGESLLLTRKELAEKYNDKNDYFCGSWAMIHLYGSPYAKLIKS